MVFIVGLGRSGSTLLTSILNNHSDIKAIPEIPLVMFFLHEFKNIKEKSEKLEKNSVVYLDLIQNIRPQSIINLKTENLHKIQYSNYREFCESVFSQFEIVNSIGAYKFYIDKNPQYTFYINELIEIDPNAKFIMLVRDYRDNVLSRMEKPHNKTDHPAYNAFRNRFYLKELSKKKGIKNSILIRYEDLAKSPEFEIKKICDFLCIPFNQKMFEFDKAQYSNLTVKRSDMNEFINKHFSNLGKPITEASVGKWKNKLNDKEIQLIESICHKYGKGFNYSNSSITKPYVYYVIRYLPHYLLAKWHILKDRLIYYVPSSIKLKRLKNIHQKFSS
ncbi:MAG: sulfotransferase [Flavobacteriales bacterium]|nr:sulfotransferase [Flavobacteriales bacterium]